MQTSSNARPKRWTLQGFRDGVVMTLPLLPGVFAFGMAFGTVAARKGFSLFDTLAMNGIVYAGTAQFVVIEGWPQELNAVAIAGAAMVTAMVCLRFVLIGASLRPWLGGSSAAKIYPSFFLLTDTNWVISMRYRAQGGDDPNFLVGSGAITWIVWVLSAAPGYWLGASIADPHRYGLDLVMPVFFVALMVPLWRGWRLAMGWLVAAVAAAAAHRYLGGWWYVPIGAIAGSVTGGWLSERE